jgi:hypothetical protein
MLRDGGNADEENQDTDDLGLEPQDRIGVHGKCSTDSSLQDLPPGDGEGGCTGFGRRRHPSHRQSFRAVTAPSTEIFDLALSALGWRLAPAARAKLVVRKANRSRSSGSAFVAASEHQPERHRGNALNSSAAC